MQKTIPLVIVFVVIAALSLFSLQSINHSIKLTYGLENQLAAVSVSPIAVDVVNSTDPNSGHNYLGNMLTITTWFSSGSLPRIDVYLCQGGTICPRDGSTAKLATGIRPKTNPDSRPWTADRLGEYYFAVCLSGKTGVGDCSLSDSFLIEQPLQLNERRVTFSIVNPVFISSPLAIFSISYSASDNSSLACTATNFGTCQVSKIVPAGTAMTWRSSCTSATITIVPGSSQPSYHSVTFDCRKYSPLGPAKPGDDDKDGKTYRPVSLLQDFLIYAAHHTGLMSGLCIKDGGFMRPELTGATRGFYGSYTANDVELFQCSRGLPRTGVFGETTLYWASHLIEQGL